MEFEGFGKIPRLFREVIITEKIDGTNAQVLITEDRQVIPGSRNRYLTPENDNFGFAKWCKDNEEQLRWLGPGRHFGEWWGYGIQRGYGLKTKKFSLFNVWRHKLKEGATCPPCCDTVPVIYQGEYYEGLIEQVLQNLKDQGSYASRDFMDPEGIIIFHERAKQLFKVTLDGDREKEEDGKSQVLQ